MTEMLALFRPKTVELTADEIRSRIPDEVQTTAINNRLERLRDLDFLKRRRVGKFWLYSRA